MFYTVIEIIASFLEIYFLFGLFGMFFKKRINSRFYFSCILTLCIILTLIITYLNTIILYSYSTLAIWIISVTLAGFLMYKNNPVRICSIASLYIVIISSFDALFLIFVEYVLRAPNFVYAVTNGNCPERVVALVIFKLSLSFAYLFIKSKKYKLSISIFTSLILLISSFLGFASMQYLVANFFSDKQGNVQTVILVAFAFMSLFYISILLILNSHEKIRHKALENGLIESKLKLTEERNNRIIENYREIAKLSHDYNNQMKVIYQLLVNGQTNAARDYLSEIVNTNTHKSLSITGIHAIDAVLSEKNRYSKANNISIVFDVAITSIHGIKEIDICTILLNLLDNAIEACLRINESNNRVIKVIIKSVNSMVFIKIENPVIAEAVPTGKSFFIKTSKENEEKHGFGLLIVDSVAKKYNGSLLIKKENGVFSSSLLLSN